MKLTKCCPGGQQTANPNELQPQCGRLANFSLRSCSLHFVCDTSPNIHVQRKVARSKCSKQSLYTMTRYFRRIGVPEYLKVGSFYENLCVSDDHTFGIPRDCFKFDPSVETAKDLVSLQRTVRFWSLYEIPLSAFEFIVCGAELAEYKNVVAGMKEFETFVRSALKVRAAFPFNTIQVAITEGFGLRAVRLLRSQGYWWSAKCCEAAVSVGDLECLKFLHSKGCP